MAFSAQAVLLLLVLLVGPCCQTAAAETLTCDNGSSGAPFNVAITCRAPKEQESKFCLIWQKNATTNNPFLLAQKEGAEKVLNKCRPGSRVHFLPVQNQQPNSKVEFGNWSEARRKAHPNNETDEILMRKFITDNGIQHIFSGGTARATVEWIANNFRSLNFTVVDSEGFDGFDNDLSHRFEFIAFKDHIGGFRAGMLAADASKTGRVMAMLGQESPALRRFASGFVQGVRERGGFYGVELAFANSFQASENVTVTPFVRTMIAAFNIDVAFVAGGALGLNVLKDIADTVKVIGVDNDVFLTDFTCPSCTLGNLTLCPACMSETKRSNVLGSVLKNVGLSIEQHLENTLLGRFSSGLAVFDNARAFQMAPCHEACKHIRKGGQVDSGDAASRDSGVSQAGYVESPVWVPTNGAGFVDVNIQRPLGGTPRASSVLVSLGPSRILMLDGNRTFISFVDTAALTLTSLPVANTTTVIKAAHVITPVRRAHFAAGPAKHFTVTSGIVTLEHTVALAFGGVAVDAPDTPLDTLFAVGFNPGCSASGIPESKDVCTMWPQYWNVAVRTGEPTPVARMKHQMVSGYWPVDGGSAQRVLFMFGGLDNKSQPLNDLWKVVLKPRNESDTTLQASWEQLPSAPGARSQHAMAWWVPPADGQFGAGLDLETTQDNKEGLLVIAGGQGAPGDESRIPFVAYFDPKTKRWFSTLAVQRERSMGGPVATLATAPRRLGACLAWVGSRFVLYGGEDAAPKNTAVDRHWLVFSPQHGSVSETLVTSDFSAIPDNVVTTCVATQEQPTPRFMYILPTETNTTGSLVVIRREGQTCEFAGGRGLSPNGTCVACHPPLRLLPGEGGTGECFECLDCDGPLLSPAALGAIVASALFAVGTAVGIVVWKLVLRPSARRAANAPRKGPFAIFVIDARVPSAHWRTNPYAAGQALARYHESVTKAVAKHRCYRADIVGDAHFVVAHTVRHATKCIVDVMQAIESNAAAEQRVGSFGGGGGVGEVRVNDVGVATQPTGPLVQARAALHWGAPHVVVAVTGRFAYTGDDADLALSLGREARGGEVLVTAPCLEQLSLPEHPAVRLHGHRHVAVRHADELLRVAVATIAPPVFAEPPSSGRGPVTDSSDAETPTKKRGRPAALGVVPVAGADGDDGADADVLSHLASPNSVAIDGLPSFGLDEARGHPIVQEGIMYPEEALASLEIILRTLDGLLGPLTPAERTTWLGKLGAGRSRGGGGGGSPRNGAGAPVGSGGDQTAARRHIAHRTLSTLDAVDFKIALENIPMAMHASHGSEPGGDSFRLLPRF